MPVCENIWIFTVRKILAETMGSIVSSISKQDHPRIVVLGASSRLGRMVHHVWQQGDMGTDLGPGADLTDVIWQSRRAVRGLDLVQMPLLDNRDQLARLCSGADVVLNLAGVVPAYVGQAGGQAEFADNSRLALATLDAAQMAGVRHVFLVSTAAVYGPSDTPQPEQTPLAPTSAYGLAKQNMEAAALAWQRATVEPSPGLSILRIGNIVGADALIGQAKTPPVTLDQFADGQTPQRSYIGPQTLARVLGHLVHLAHFEMGGQDLPRCLNIAAPHPVSMQALCEAAGLPWQPRVAPKTAIARLILNTDRLQTLYKFTAQDSTPAHMIAQWQTMEARRP